MGNHFNQINMNFLNQAKIEDNGDKKMSLVITIDSQNDGEVREDSQSVRSESDKSNQEPDIMVTAIESERRSKSLPNLHKLSVMKLEGSGSLPNLSELEGSRSLPN